MNLKITEVEHYTSKLFRIRTERPQSFRFTAGEFVMIGLPGLKVKRAYSVSSGPYDEFLEFYSIKAPDGALTSELQKVKQGDLLEVSEKTSGTLTLANLELGGNLWLMATGTGIAPFISLLRDPETFESFDSINVTWTVRHSAELAAYNDFLQDTCLLYFPTVTQEDFVNKGRIQQFINKEITIDNPLRDKVLLCGSINFNTDLKDYFLDRGWNEGSNRTVGTLLQEKAFVS